MSIGGDDLLGVLSFCVEDSCIFALIGCFSECLPADDTNAAFEISEPRQAPMAALYPGYIGRPVEWKGALWQVMALSGQSSCARVCLLLDQSGQRWILAGDGLSANDPQRTCGRQIADDNSRPLALSHAHTAKPRSAMF